MEFEYNSMESLYETSPDFVPKPHTWGKFQMEAPETYFFLGDFIDMTDSMTDNMTKTCQIPSCSAPNSQSSIARVNPLAGMFGFHIPICHGRFAQEATWDPSGTSFFTKLLRSALVLEKQECSLWSEYETIAERVLSHVIPRLLGVLEEKGRKITPSLIHGDL